MHDWEVTERTVFDKSKPFDPKTTPIADYSKIKICKRCGARESEVGYIIDGIDCAYGVSTAGGLCCEY